jgi:HEPN superfamily AbiU2-like protein
MGTPGTATQLPPLDVGKALYELFNEVIIGTAYLSMAKSLAAASKSHPIITRVSPHFFGMTTNAHLESAQLYAAKLFDEHDDCASIPWLLKQAKNRPHEFKNRPTSELDEAIKEAEQVCAAKASVLMALKHRRDRWLAHLDRKTVRDPVQFSQDAKLTYQELEDLFTAATDVLNVMADLHGVPGFLIGGGDYDDFSRTLELIEKGVQANANELERRIGPCPDLTGSF